MVEGVPWVQGQPGICNKYEAGQGYIVRPYLKKQKQSKAKNTSDQEGDNC